MMFEGISFARLLSDLQELKGIRQEIIADRFDCTQQYISAIIAGHRKPSKRIREIIFEWATENNLLLKDYTVDLSDIRPDISELCIRLAGLKNHKEIIGTLNHMIEQF